MRRLHVVIVIVAVIALWAGAGVRAAELKPATVTAFERYRRIAEAEIAADIAAPNRFLRTLPDDESRRRVVEAQLRRGEVRVERRHVSEHGRPIDIPDGLVHHWVGALFVPGAHLDAAVALIEDFDRHSILFRPAVTRSALLERDGDRFRVYLRFFLKRVLSATVNTESIAEFTHHGNDRVSGAVRSTRIAEVEDPDTTNEREKPVGRDSGLLWRLNIYWRFLERDGGTYVECESVTLTRGIPTGLGWLVGPFINSVPRDLLTGTLQATRRNLQAP